MCACANSPDIRLFCSNYMQCSLIRLQHFTHFKSSASPPQGPTAGTINMEGYSFLDWPHFSEANPGGRAQSRFA